jgi:excinuclease ABC subunit A
VQDVLYAALRKQKGKPTEAPGAHRATARRTSTSPRWRWSTRRRSARRRAPTRPATSAPSTRSATCSPGAPDREGARLHAGTFSFNSGNGRCPTCGGNGFEHVEMQFLSDVYLRCPDCDGKRFRAEVLEVALRAGKSIADVLD